MFKNNDDDLQEQKEITNNIEERTEPSVLSSVRHEDEPITTSPSRDASSIIDVDVDDDDKKESNHINSLMDGNYHPQQQQVWNPEFQFGYSKITMTINRNRRKLQITQKKNHLNYLNYHLFDVRMNLLLRFPTMTMMRKNQTMITTPLWI